MMNEEIWQQAEKLAAQPYAIEYVTDELSDGRQIIVVSHPELPVVKAQGLSLDEARSNLYDARVDYIYSLLVDNLPVPQPQASHLAGVEAHTLSTSKTWYINAASSGESVATTRSDASWPDVEQGITVSLGGDLLKPI
jgi:predicted RNase H-like HicB family nuclease